MINDGSCDYNFILTDEMNTSDITVWEVVSGYLSGRSVAITSTCCTDIQQHYNKVLKERYPFATPEKLLQWKIEHDAYALETKPYKQTYIAVYRSINTWALEFYDNYATCNPRYARKDMMVEDVAGVLRQVLMFRFGLSSEICKRSVWDENSLVRAAYKMLPIVSCSVDGLTSRHACSYESTNRKDKEMEKSITDFLRKFNV